MHKVRRPTKRRSNLETRHNLGSRKLKDLSKLPSLVEIVHNLHFENTGNAQALTNPGSVPPGSLNHNCKGSLQFQVQQILQKTALLPTPAQLNACPRAASLCPVSALCHCTKSTYTITSTTNTLPQNAQLPPLQHMPQPASLQLPTTTAQFLTLQFQSTSTQLPYLQTTKQLPPLQTTTQLPTLQETTPLPPLQLHSQPQPRQQIQLQSQPPALYPHSAPHLPPHQSLSAKNMRSAGMECSCYARLRYLIAVIWD